MGKKPSSSKLFYQFSLEERIPADHLLRQVTAAVDFSFVRRLTERFSSHTGQPSVDPIGLFKMALLGYLDGVTSERRLADEIGLHLAYRWFLGDDLDEPTPDHSVRSKARARFGPTVDQAFFTEVVRARRTSNRPLDPAAPDRCGSLGFARGGIRRRSRNRSLPVPPGQVGSTTRRHARRAGDRRDPLPS
jgi:transposase